MSRSILITGANRGIGLEFVKQYAEAGWRVVACCRSGAKELGDHAASWGDVVVYPLDIGCYKSIGSLAQTLGDWPIDILCNNAGAGDVSPTQQFGSLELDDARALFDVNVLGPLKLVELLLENIEQGSHKTIAMISSDMASIELNISGGSYLYRASKSALNAITRTLAIDLKSRGIKTIALHPGSVKTRMGGFEAAEIGPDESVSALRTLIDNISDADSGTFVSYNNTSLPW